MLTVRQMMLMRNLSVALSACIYQCLCDSDTVAVSAADMATSSYSVSVEGYTSTNVLYKDSHLMAGMMRQKHRHRHSSAAFPEIPNSLPAKWPGMAAFSKKMSLLVLLLHMVCQSALFAQFANFSSKANM